MRASAIIAPLPESARQWILDYDRHSVQLSALGRDDRTRVAKPFEFVFDYKREIA